MTLEEENRMAAGWRGRRFLACQAADTLAKVIGSLREDNGADLPPEGGLPHPPTIRQIGEMQNQCATLLRTILLWNDGVVSPDQLNRF